MEVFLLAVLTVASSTAADNVLNLRKGVIVHLFEWTYSDIAKECEDFLAPNGFSGVQISPPSENRIVNDPQRPWWERYQVVSYKLISRSGSEKDLQDMLRRCNKAGVKIFADVILNHMTGPGIHVVGVGGSVADATNYRYPAVPYSIIDFHRPECAVRNYNNATEVRDCELLGLRDLNNSKDYVRKKQVEYLDKLIEMGVAGFRIDAAKHMWPEDLKNIYSRLKDLNTEHGFPANTKPLIYQEVIDMGGEAVKYEEYAPLGMVTDFRYGYELGRAFQGLRDLADLKDFGSGSSWKLLPNETGLVFIDNHDNQRDSNTNILNYKKFRPYKMALAFMLAYPYGTPMMISSFYFDNRDQGPPHDSEYNTLSPQPIKDNICANRWVCEHRWRQVYNMVNFHNIVNGTSVTNWWDNGKDQISFCRGDRGFIAFNRDPSAALDRKLQTCLPKGKYCDIISGNLVNNKCTGKVVDVGGDGAGEVFIKAFNLDDPNVENDGVLALHIKDVIVEEKEAPEKPDKGNTPAGSGSGADKDKPSPECHCPSSGDSKTPSSAGSSGGNNPPSSSGTGSACEKLLQVLGLLDSSSCLPTASKVASADDVALIAAVARVRKLEKMLSLLSLI